MASEGLTVLATRRISAGLFRRNIVRPDLCAMDDAEDTNAVFGYDISGDIECARDNQLPRTFNPAWSAALRKLDKTVRCKLDLLVYANGSSGVFRFDVRKDIVAIRECMSRPNKLHRLSAAIF